MPDRALRTAVIGSYPLPGWLEFATRHLDQFGRNDIDELQEDAVIAAIRKANGKLVSVQPVRQSLEDLFVE